MRTNQLPNWAARALLNGPVFGSDNDGDEEAGAPATTANPPEEKVESEKPIVIDPDAHAKAVKERDSANSELAALRQEKQEREEAEEAAAAATRSKEENQAKEIGRLTEDNNKLNLVNEQNLLELAILKNKKYEWNDANVAMKLIDRSNVKIDTKTGQVDGVDDALKDLAKQHPYLLRSDKKNDQGNPGGGAGSGLPGQPSGGTPVGNGDSSSKANKRKQMEDRFPVLRV